MLKKFFPRKIHKNFNKIINEKNRVLHIISSLNTGGAELFLYNLLKDLKDNKIHHEVLCLSVKDP